MGRASCPDRRSVRGYRIDDGPVFFITNSNRRKDVMNETEIEKQLERARSEYIVERWITGKHKREDGLMDFGDYVFEFTMERLGVEVKSYE